MMFRLPSVPGEWLDRTRALRFTFEGRRYQGFIGDTITSALAAQGVMILSRSSRLRRPRGILSFGTGDVNALLQLATTANVRGDIVALAEGMRVRSVNTVSGLAGDYARLLKHRPRFLRNLDLSYGSLWERWRRRRSNQELLAASVGPRSSKRHAFCDVLVIGAGRSGVAAALAAGQAGAQVILVDEQARPGSATASLLQHAQPRVQFWTGTSVAGCYADHCSIAVAGQSLSIVRSCATVLATGAVEQPLVFRNNDLPGILLASAARRLLQRHAISVGREVCVATTNRAGYETAQLLLEHGVAVRHLVDLRAQADLDLRELLQSRGVKVLPDYRISAAQAGRNGCLRGIDVAPLMQRAWGEPEHIACDALLMSGGWTPQLQLLRQAGGKLTFNETAQMHVVIELPAGWCVAGGANAVLDPDAKAIDGRRAGAAAAGAAGFSVAASDLEVLPARGQLVAIAIHADEHGADFVDFEMDVQVADLEQAALAGCDSFELLERYTGVGLGPSHGAHCSVSAARVLAGWHGVSVDQVGLTGARPLSRPVSLQHLAGRQRPLEPTTQLTQWHQRAGASWTSIGAWRYPQFYAAAAQTQSAAVAAEVAAVHEAVGLMDLSTHGKLEVHGRDAAELLERTYTARCANLKVGMSLYGLLLDEAGNIADDAVIARLHAQSFYCITSHARAVLVYRELARLNTQWRLDCEIVDLTGHCATICLAGPRSREVLAAVSSIHPSDTAFPQHAVRTAQVAGVRARLLRVGCCSELSFQIHVPFSKALHVWEALHRAGLPLGLRACGLAAQRLLRLERGHFIVGQDTDGMTNPFEVHAETAVCMDKPFFVGQRSLHILEQRGPRQCLVGFELPGIAPALREGHLVIDRGEIAGRITSLGHSLQLAKTIGLALVRPSLATPGTPLTPRLETGKLLNARVSTLPFLGTPPSSIPVVRS